MCQIFSKKTLIIKGVILVGLIVFLTIGFRSYRKHRKYQKALERQARQTIPMSVRWLKKEHINFEYYPIMLGFRVDYKPFPFGDNCIFNHPVSPEAFVLRIPDGKAIGGIVIVADKYVLSDLLRDAPYRSLFRQEAPKAYEKISGRIACLATDSCDYNYCHWVFEVLPRLKLIKDSGLEYDRLYVSMDPNFQFQKRTLELLGVDLSKIINAIGHPAIEAEVLVVPSTSSSAHYIPPWAIDYLRNEMFSRMRPATVPLAKKIYIGRKPSTSGKSRKLHNEDLLFAKLKIEGFQKYHLEDLSVDDQIQLFSQADCIVALHGAGLANLLFCKRGTAIVEIFQAFDEDVFCFLSQTLGLRYTAIQTVPFDLPPHIPFSADKPDEIGGVKDTSLTECNIEAILFAVNNPPAFQDSPIGINATQTPFEVIFSRQVN